MERLIACSVICAAFVALAGHASAQTVRFTQDRFAIGFWVDPPIGDDADARYAEIAEANFTLVIGGFGGNTPELVRRQLGLCEKHGLVAVVATAGLPPDQLPESEACWGYSLRDEPNAADFPPLAEAVKAIRKARPGKLAYINMLPNYASPAQLGAADYDEYARRFADELDVDVLSMDYYPMMTPTADGRDGYCTNLDVMRRESLRKGVPFWNFFNAMPFGPHYDPTESQMAWQIYTSLAYGAKGVLYFCYWTPRGGEFPKGGAIITAEGRKTRHYEQAKRLNHEVRNLGRTLMELTSTGVVRLPRDADPAALPTGVPVRPVTSGDYLIGLFDHSDGRQAVLLNNYDPNYTSWPTVELAVDPAEVVEVDPATGDEVPVVDDSPDMEGLQLSLDAGKGRLFLLPPA